MPLLRSHPADNGHGPGAVGRTPVGKAGGDACAPPPGESRPGSGVSHVGLRGMGLYLGPTSVPGAWPVPVRWSSCGASPSTPCGHGVRSGGGVRILPRVQSPFRAQSDMGFWDKSLDIFNCLCDHGKQSIRRLAHKTGLSKNSVHRLQQARERRGHHPESWLWETEEGRRWLSRLMVATLSTSA